MALIAKVPNSFTLLFHSVFVFCYTSKDKRIILAFASLYSENAQSWGVKKSSHPTHQYGLTFHLLGDNNLIPLPFRQKKNLNGIVRLKEFTQ